MAAFAKRYENLTLEDNFGRKSMNKILFFLLLTIFVNPVNAYTLKFTEEDLQKQVSAMMPLETKQLFLTINISDPVVKLLKSENKINIKTNIEAIIPGGIKGTGNINITGTLSYNNKNGTFYFKDPVINEMNVDNVAEKYQSSIKDLAQDSIVKAMSTRPVYTLRDDNEKHTLAKSVLKSMMVKNGILIVELAPF